MLLLELLSEILLKFLLYNCHVK